MLPALSFFFDRVYYPAHEKIVRATYDRSSYICNFLFYLATLPWKPGNRILGSSFFTHNVFLSPAAKKIGQHQTRAKWQGVSLIRLTPCDVERVTF
jgi:hypothetical protein